MHSFPPSLSFLLCFFLLPLLQGLQIGVPLATFDVPNSHSPAVNHGLGLQVARAAELHHMAKFSSESETPVLQDNASSSLTQSDIVNDASHPQAASSSSSGHSRLTPPLIHRRHAALHHARDAAALSDDDINNTTNGQSDSDEILYPGRRAANAQFTNFVTGQGACGGFNVASDFVAALNTEQWDNGAHCFAAITITINGKSVQAQIVDECMACGYNNLDLTDGLFSVWADIEQGALQGEWEYGSDAQPKPISTPAPIPKTTQRPTTTWKPATTVSSSSNSVAATSLAVSNSTAAVPTQSALQVQSGNLELMYLSTIGMGGLLMGTLG